MRAADLPLASTTPAVPFHSFLKHLKSGEFSFLFSRSELDFGQF
jgi:hypothetical protein